MATYKVYEVAESQTNSGKSLKKLVLQGDGKQYPEKNVTMWGDHPLFAEIAPGQTVELDIDIKDSNVPNPHGGFYKNKTVRNPARTSKPATPAPTPLEAIEARIFNLITFKVVPLLEEIKKEQIIISERLGMETAKPNLDYPEDADKYVDDSNPF